MLTLELHGGPPDAVWGRQVDVWWGFSSDTDLILRNFGKRNFYDDVTFV